MIRRLLSFIRELRRRGVFHALALYGVVSWGIVEVADVVVPRIHLPDYTVTLVIVLLAAGMPAAAILAWAYDVTRRGVISANGPDGTPRPRPDEEEEAGAVRPAGARTVERTGQPPAHGERDRGSIAVLPFADMSPAGDQEYFSDGLTEEMINALTRIPGARVAARTSAFSFKGVDLDVREIGRRLGVATVLEGSVRRAGDELRVTVQLVDARDGYHLWSDTYNRRLENVLRVQDEISRAVARRLRLDLHEDEDPGAEVRRGSRDPRAYDLYLRGRHHWNQRTEEGFRRALRHFERALERDPEFAAVLGARADAYLTLGIYGAAPPRDVMPLARSSAEQALELAPNLAEALNARACVRAEYEWSFDAAESDFRLAISSNPDYPGAHHWCAVNLLAPLGRFEEARSALATARSRDPVSLPILTSEGVISFVERSFDRAEAELREVLELSDDFGLAHYFLGQVLLEQGRAEDAVQELERAVELSGGSVETRSAAGYAYGRSGRREDARRVLRELEREATTSYVSPVHVAQVLLGLGEHDEALERLSAAVKVRASELVWLNVRPLYDPLRDDARFGAIARSVGLPD